MEEILISPVIPMMSVYRLPHGEYVYSGHVINLSQDVLKFCRGTLLLSIKKVVPNFCVCRSKVLAALQWLMRNNKYFSNVLIDYSNLSALPENEVVSDVPTLSVHNDMDNAV